MAVKNFGKGNSAAVNYSVKVLPDNSVIFATRCEAGDEGAVEMVYGAKSKNAGQKYYVRGGNSITGNLSFIGTRDGYEGNGKELLLGFRGEGNEPMEFVQIPAIGDKHRLNDYTNRLLAGLKNASLGEPLTVAVFNFTHKAGEEMKNKDGEVVGTYEKDGSNLVMSVYQDHLVTDDNPNGKVSVSREDMLVQERLMMQGRSLVPVPEGQRVDRSLVVYEEGVADKYLVDTVAAIKGSIPKHAHAERVASASVGNTEPSFVDHDDSDLVFGEEGEAPAGNRMR